MFHIGIESPHLFYYSGENDISSSIYHTCTEGFVTFLPNCLNCFTRFLRCQFNEGLCTFFEEISLSNWIKNWGLSMCRVLDAKLLIMYSLMYQFMSESSLCSLTDCDCTVCWTLGFHSNWQISYVRDKAFSHLTEDQVKFKASIGLSPTKELSLPLTRVI